MAPHSSTLAWKTPWKEEPGRLQCMGSLSRIRLSNFTFTFHFHALEKEMATHSSVLAWRIPGIGEPGRLQSMGSHRVGHDWSNLAAAADISMCAQSCLTLCDAMDCSLPGSSVHGIFPGKNTRVGYQSLLQGVFLNQGSNPHRLNLLHWQVDSLLLCHLGSPKISRNKIKINVLDLYDKTKHFKTQSVICLKP